MISNELYIDRIILTQRKYIKTYIYFACSLILIGILIIIFALLFFQNTADDTVKLIVGIGGGFISTLSSLPIKEVVNRKSKIELFLDFRNQQIVHSEQEISKINDLIWKTIEKIALE
jgi:hypothetical protein